MIALPSMVTLKPSTVPSWVSVPLKPSKVVEATEPNATVSSALEKWGSTTGGAGLGAGAGAGVG